VAKPADAPVKCPACKGKGTRTKKGNPAETTCEICGGEKTVTRADARASRFRVLREEEEP
jgi:DnaJ-class molecular chaperone